jgi:hypothetical protein
MTEQRVPPAINGTEMRLDALIGELRALRDLLTPAAKPEREDGTVELREPGTGDDGPPNQGPLTGIKLGPHRPEPPAPKRKR